MWSHRHLLGIAQLSRDDILHVLDAAERWFDMPRDEVKNARVLHGRTVVNLFYESSTRTRTSFEVAGKRLGRRRRQREPADLERHQGRDAARHRARTSRPCAPTRSSCATRPRARRTSSRRTRAASIVNAGDGAHEHPTQALLDAFTIRRAQEAARGARRRHLRRHPALARRAVERARCSARSASRSASAARARSCRATPESLGPTVRAFERIEDAVDGADVVMMLRIQNERLAGRDDRRARASTRGPSA